MREYLKKLLVAWLKPSIDAQTEHQTGEAISALERRIANQLTDLEQRVAVNVQKNNRVPLVVTTFVSLIAVAITYLSAWHQFIRESHKLKAYVLTASSNQHISSAEV